MYQKRLEKETGCLIAVRGVGCKGRKDGVQMEEDTMPIHVYVSKMLGMDWFHVCLYIRYVHSMLFRVC